MPAFGRRVRPIGVPGIGLEASRPNTIQPGGVRHLEVRAGSSNDALAPGPPLGVEPPPSVGSVGGPPLAAESATPASAHGDGGAGACSDAQGIAGAEVDPMLGVTWDLVDLGGVVCRHGKPIGRVTEWSSSYGLRCLVHPSCSIAVSSKVSMEDCARWFSLGQALPSFATDAERKAAKKAHFSAPRPRAPRAARAKRAGRK